MAAPVHVVVLEGRAALRAGDAATARRLFESDLVDASSGEVLEGLARVAYLELDYESAIERWERAYAAHRDRDDCVGAVRVARTLAYMYGSVVGDAAVMAGWMARAQTLLSETGDSPEWGWVALNRGMFEPDRARKEQLFRDAFAIARQTGDTDLEFATLAYLGASLVHGDRVEEGMMLLDEALAAVAGREVEDFCVLEEIFCQLFSACEHAHDVTRADQWIRVGTAMAQRRNLPLVAAFCHTHYGGVLTAAGRWSEADQTLSEAVRLWTLGRGLLRAGALVRLADLRVRQGRFEEALQLLEGFDATTNPEVARPLAAIQLANGQTSLARDTLERALQQIDEESTTAAPLWALLVDVHLAANRPDLAGAAADRLAVCATLHSSDYLMAVSALARGRVCVAAGTGDSQTCLREALAGFARAQMPVEVAHSRMELASSLLVDHPEVALAEARTALETFDRLQAARHADEAAALLRSLGVRTTAKPAAGLLSKRESEVLDLLACGLSNPEISERLYISRKTVEHHVGHILTKLGVRSRAEAVAYMVRTKPGAQ